MPTVQELRQCLRVFQPIIKDLIGLREIPPTKIVPHLRDPHMIAIHNLGKVMVGANPFTNMVISKAEDSGIILPWMPMFVEVLGHEYEHARQYETKELVMLGSAKASWRGELVTIVDPELDYKAYESSPWEVAARETGRKVREALSLFSTNWEKL
jgi:hypothetical protein